MKWILFSNLLLFVGLSLADTSSGIEESDSSQDTSSIEDISVMRREKRPVLRKAVRNVFADMGVQFLPWIEAAVISNCKANGRIDEANRLQSTYDEMKVCIKNEPMFISSKDEVIANIEECSREAIKRTQSCLADEQRYYPGFILDLVKSMVNFLYDDFDIIRLDLAACIPRFNRSDVQMSYIQCLTDTAIQTQDTTNIPRSKASFCQKFIPTCHCFTDMIKNTCDRTPNFDILREDYINAMKRPCDKKELY